MEDALACAKNKTLHEVSDCLRSSLWSWVQQKLNGSADQQPTSASLMKAGALLDLQNTVVIYTVEDALVCAKTKPCMRLVTVCGHHCGHGYSK